MQTVAVADLAKAQHGVVTRSQIVGLGVAGNTVDRWLRAGRLHRLVPGVYAVGHRAITRRGRWMAAVLASGDGAVLSHRSATALYGAWGSGTGEIHVTVPRKLRSQPPIRRHFSVLPDDEVETVDDIPVTSASRAVLDLAAERGEAAAESALRELEYLGTYGKVPLPTLLARHPKHPGAQACREALEHLRNDPGGRIRSDLEEAFIAFLDAKGIPRPRLNPWLSLGEDRIQVDCLWPEPRLIVELDDWKSHGTKRGFRKDRERDRRLGVAGYRVIRITEDQIRREPDSLAADLQASVIAYAPWRP
jgi:hypothetical protein